MILFANRQLADMIGVSMDDLAGARFTDFMSPERVQELVAKYKTPLDSGQPVPDIFETALRHSNGSEVAVEISAAIINYQGQRSGLTFVRNISERKRAEAEQELLQQQLLQSQKMEAIGTLAGGMAHDFNNALAVILGTAEIAIRKTAPDDLNYTRFHKIIKASERARHLTMKLLTFARKDKLNVQAVSLNALAEDCIDILKQTVSKKIILKTQLAPERCIVSADPNQLHQALFNICLNACEAMPYGGELVISTSQGHFRELEFPSPDRFEPGEYCRVSVTDNGPGISQDMLEKIFDPFFTTKKSGTGLGLAITLGIIRSHGGHLTARNLEQGGTEFLILLPYAPGKIDTQHLESVFKEHHGGGERIMIIDDDKDFTDLALEALEMAGFRPFVVPTGQAAVEMFQKHHAQVDLVILDMMMPELDGREMFLACREIRPDIKIILCSGYSRDRSITELLDMGVSGFLQKPFTVNDLCEKIDDVLRQ
jgi:PAS domain S-box-containing protein